MVGLESNDRLFFFFRSATLIKNTWLVLTLFSFEKIHFMFVFYLGW